MLITCKLCGQEKEEHSNRKGICVDCAKAKQNRYALKRRNNEDWLKIAEDNEIPLYEKQPEETETEYKVWLAYRDMYPSTKPNLRVVSEQLGIGYGHVKDVSARWDFSVRLQAWVKYCDELTRQQRATEIVGMNQVHISMAKKLQEKLKIAIDNIDPYTLEPKDINGLMKTATEIERKAYNDGTEEYKPVVVKNGDGAGTLTKKEDIEEVLKILGSAGVLGSKKTIGIETTQRVIVKDDEE